MNKNLNLTETTLEQLYVFEGKIINTRLDKIRLPNGKDASREVVEHPGGVCVAAITDKNEILFVNQFRYPYKETVLEVPAGKLSAGEDPLECGKRELREETGATAEKYTSLGVLYPSPGYCAEKIHMYMAQGLSFGEQDLDDDEFLEVLKIPLETAVKMVLSNEIPDSKTQVCILKLKMLLDSVDTR